MLLNWSLGSGPDDFNIYTTDVCIQFPPEITQLTVSVQDMQSAEQEPWSQNEFCDNLKIENTQETQPEHQKRFPVG